MTRTILIAHPAICEIAQRESGETAPDRQPLTGMAAKVLLGTSATEFAQ
jgi:hypothetical protein